MKNQTRTILEDIMLLRIWILDKLAKYMPLRVIRNFYKQCKKEEEAELELFRGLFFRD